MPSSIDLAAMTVELRRNTSKPSFEAWPRGEDLRTIHGFFTTLSPLRGESQAAVVNLW